jgi:hypothetical protein
MQKNPYDRNLRRGQIKIAYEGLRDNRYCFRVKLAGHLGMDGLMFRTNIANWLLSEATGKPLFGNGFDGIVLNNPANADFFILFDRLSDIARFEEHFEITGFSPSGRPLLHRAA